MSVKPVVKTEPTLEKRIKQKLEEIDQTCHTTIGALKARIEKWKNELETLRRENQRHTIRARNDLERQLASGEKELAELREGRPQKDFEDKARPFLEAMEHDDMVAAMDAKIRPEKRRKTNAATTSAWTTRAPTAKISAATGQKKTGLMDFCTFMPDPSKAIESTKFTELMALKKEAPVSGLESSKHLIIEDYLNECDHVPPSILLQVEEECEKCGETLLLISDRALLACPECGMSQHFLDATANSVAYGEDVDVSSFSYSRAGHFDEWLRHIQGKETSEVPDDIMEQVITRLDEDRVTRIQDVTIERVRQVLRALKLRKYYDHATHIWCRLTGKKPPRFTPLQEMKLKVQFLQIQEPWLRHKPEGRKNFLSYPFVLFKLAQINGWESVFSFFALLKGADKLQKQEVIFEKICKDLGWQFIPVPKITN